MSVLGMGTFQNKAHTEWIGVLKVLEDHLYIYFFKQLNSYCQIFPGKPWSSKSDLFSYVPQEPLFSKQECCVIFYAANHFEFIHLSAIFIKEKKKTALLVYFYVLLYKTQNSYAKHLRKKTEANTIYCMLYDDFSCLSNTGVISNSVLQYRMDCL